MAKRMEAMFFFNFKRNFADCSPDASRGFKFPSLIRSGFSQVERYWHMVTWHADLIWDFESVFLFLHGFWMRILEIWLTFARINVAMYFLSESQEFWLFPGQFLQICCKELAKLDHAGDNYGEVAEDLCDRLAIPGAMIFDPHVWLVNRHE